jgi:hypothetical protein
MQRRKMFKAKYGTLTPESVYCGQGDPGNRGDERRKVRRFGLFWGGLRHNSTSLGPRRSLTSYKSLIVRTE